MFAPLALQLQCNYSAIGQKEVQLSVRRTGGENFPSNIRLETCSPLPLQSMR